MWWWFRDNLMSSPAIYSQCKDIIIFNRLMMAVLDELNFNLHLYSSYCYIYYAVQSQKAVSAYFTSKQILPFDFSEQYWFKHQMIWRQLHIKVYPANMRRRPNVSLQLAHRLRRWPNRKTTLARAVLIQVDNFIPLTARLYSFRFFLLGH